MSLASIKFRRGHVPNFSSSRGIARFISERFGTTHGSRSKSRSFFGIPLGQLNPNLARWFEKNGFQSWQIAIGDVTAAGHWLVAQGIADRRSLGSLAGPMGAMRLSSPRSRSLNCSRRLSQSRR
jgi:hypothetical protein